MTIFGEYIREARQGLGMTIEELAKKIDISPSMMSRIETGKRGVPNMERVLQLAGALKLDFEEVRRVASQSLEEDRHHIQEADGPLSLVEIQAAIRLADNEPYIVGTVPILRNIMPGRELLDSRHIVGGKVHLGKSPLIPIFYFEVSDDSMIEAGIYKGDYLLIRSTSNPEPGRLSLIYPDASGNQPATLRTFYYSPKNDLAFYLAANHEIPPIIVPREEARERLLGIALKLERSME